MSRDRQLSVQSVLEYLDGPILFLAQDEAETSYICSFLRHNLNTTEFLCSRFAPSILRRFLAGSIDLREAITTAKIPENLLLVVHENQGQDEPLVARSLKSLDEIDPQLLPAEGYFIPPEIGNAILSTEHAMIEASLELSEAMTEHVISSYTFAAFIKTFQDVLKFSFKKSLADVPVALKKILSNSDDYMFQISGMGPHASFSVIMRSKEQADLSQHVNFERALNLLETIVKNSSNSDLTIEELKKHKGYLVNAYRRLLKFLIVSKSTLRLKWHAPRNGYPIKRFSITLENAVKIDAALSERSDMEGELISFVGKVPHVNVPSGAWTIKTEEGKSFSGTVEDGSGITLSGIVVDLVHYKFDCIEKISTDSLGKEIKELYLYSYTSTAPSSTASLPLP